MGNHFNRDYCHGFGHFFDATGPKAVILKILKKFPNFFCRGGGPFEMLCKNVPLLGRIITIFVQKFAILVLTDKNFLLLRPA
jgi:hypothetical protein